MSSSSPVLVIEPLGDAAALVRLTDEAAAFRFAAAVKASGAPWLVDVVQAYTTVAAFFDLGQVAFAEVRARLLNLSLAGASRQAASPVRTHIIPCCYELGLDLQRVAQTLALSREEIVRQHCSALYTLYAIGFLPGFPYLGYLPDSLAGLPRLEQPRLEVPAGSVGLTGRQTGIYPQVSPGGWNIIGRTPLRIVDVASGYFPLRAGDRVRFEPIDLPRFRDLEGKPLPEPVSSS
jgi:inhibitor of KinA